MPNLLLNKSAFSYDKQLPNPSSRQRVVCNHAFTA